MLEDMHDISLEGSLEGSSEGSSEGSLANIIRLADDKKESTPIIK
jgi:hypothetical protein